MQFSPNVRIFIIGIGIMLSVSCGVKKWIPENDFLYTGATVKNADSVSTKSSKNAIKLVEGLTRPKPNSSFLGIRNSLWLHYKTLGSTKKIRKTIHEKWSEAPVYASNANPDRVVEAMEATLFNEGYFSARVSYTWQYDTPFATIHYRITPGERTYIGKLTPLPVTDSLTFHIQQHMQRSLLQNGVPYQLDLLKQERKRIDDALKQEGFYLFNADYLLFELDTNTFATNKVGLTMRLKPEMPKNAANIHTIQSVTVFAEYELGKQMDTLNSRLVNGFQYHGGSNYIKPKPIIQSVFIKQGLPYNRTQHNLTLNRLSNLGVYKFVTVKFTQQDSNALAATILLTPLPQRSISTEVQGVSKSNNFIGPGVNVSYRNRNTLKGAELLIAKLRTSFETQLNGPYKGQYTYEVNPTLELYVPRFLLPFSTSVRSNFVPRTKFIADISFVSRVNYYNINSFKFGYGYKWKPSLPIDHDLTLASVNYFNIFNQSADFLALINDNPTLEQRYEKQFIAGMGYSYFYNQQVFERIKRPIYFNLNLEFAGNIISGINRLRGNTPDATNPLVIFGVKYAQFVKADFDFRKQIKLDQTNSRAIIYRLFGGWGLPYGNASTVPFIKQYFSGGAYSLRGFPVYAVGPGVYIPPDSLQSLYFVQQGGEIKLETNLEYRFTYSGIVKGAFFVDAGNTWLNNNNPDIPGGKFSLNTFYKEIAVSAGTGVRIDVQYFVFRLDIGVPLRKPWLPDGNRWVLDDMDFSSARWRNQNIIWNLAFGYPF